MSYSVLLSFNSEPLLLALGETSSAATLRWAKAFITSRDTAFWWMLLATVLPAAVRVHLFCRLAGLSFFPQLLSNEKRALHDRVALSFQSRGRVLALERAKQKQLMAGSGALSVPTGAFSRALISAVHSR